MTEGLNNTTAMENGLEESCRPILFRFERDFELKNTSFIKGGVLYMYNVFSGSLSNVIKYPSCNDVKNSINEQN